MKCQIKSITNLDGSPRTDGRYPQRINSIVFIDEKYTMVGAPLMLHYILDGQGRPKDGCLATSTVEQMTMFESAFTVFTQNSIYEFERLEEFM